MDKFLNQFFDWYTRPNKIIIFIFVVNIVLIALPNELKECLHLGYSIIDYGKYSLNIFLVTAVILLISFIKRSLDIKIKKKKKRFYNYGRKKYRFSEPIVKKI